MWEVKYHPEAEKELSRLDGSVKKIVLAGILKVSQNPLPQSEGGYGKPLGKKTAWRASRRKDHAALVCVPCGAFRLSLL